jgi:hypothetical protein
MSRWAPIVSENTQRVLARGYYYDKRDESRHTHQETRGFKKTPMRGAKAKYNNNPIEKCPSQPSLRGCRRTRAAIPGKGCHRLARVINGRGSRQVETP